MKAIQYFLQHCIQPNTASDIIINACSKLFLTFLFFRLLLG